MPHLANTPKTPYYAVIFTSKLKKNDNGYAEEANKMITLAECQSGFLGIESAREAVGITVSYWSNLDSIKKWKANTEHLEAQRKGHEL
jgi:heme-degrading monooxygenase HmoA